MNIDTASKHKNNATTRIYALWRTAYMFSMPHKDILERREKIYADIAHCPRWLKKYVDGYYTALYDVYVAQHIEFCYEYNGELYSTHPDTRQKTITQLRELIGGEAICKLNNGQLYWRHSGKPFSI